MCLSINVCMKDKDLWVNYDYCFLCFFVFASFRECWKMPSADKCLNGSGMSQGLKIWGGGGGRVITCGPKIWGGGEQ
jgi:hypothetical protein